MTLDQRRCLIDLQQVWAAHMAARTMLDSHRGTLSWRYTDGHNYLVRVDGPADRRRTRSLGPRSEQTERVMAEFQANKETAQRTVSQTSDELTNLARVAKALRIARVPTPAAKVLRVLGRRGVLGNSLSVVGTTAIYAYEAVAGVFVASPMLATGDLDILLDSRRRLRLRGNEAPPVLLDMLQKADRSYVKVDGNSYSASTRKGYFVDLIRPQPKNFMSPASQDSLGGENDLQAAHIENMRWIENTPRFEAVAVGEDGFPVPISCPDPRAFALYKLWMGTQDKTRAPIKRARDVAQAKTVAEIVNEYLPMHPFEARHLTAFPKKAADLGNAADFFRSVGDEEDEAV